MSKISTGRGVEEDFRWSEKRHRGVSPWSTWQLVEVSTITVCASLLMAPGSFRAVLT